ncbi:hypothetical protein AC244_02255 [Ensifer adhaerens]|uniref:Uncharacterized protein n=1 Tax=Ensifer adhaerens TaxID=106592 RepID=A0A0L8C6G0_ENSAD|nr:hypothetical protein AC244_02255 [Ensifer adhaerens]
MLVRGQASTIVTRRGKPRAKEAARWGSKGIDIAGLPETAPTREQAAKPGFMPALTARKSGLKRAKSEGKTLGRPRSAKNRSWMCATISRQE